MKRLITILVLFITLNGFSQYFAPPGATWYYSFSTTFFDGYIKFSFENDTTILGIEAQKLARYSASYNWATGWFFPESFTGYEYTYADQDHVYQLIGDEFKLLYDFTVQPNDTILIYSSEFYDWTNECDSVGRAIVTETGTVIINGLELRWYKIASLEESTYILNGKIVERIGNTTGSLFSLPGDCIYIQELIGQFFRCYEDEDFPQYKPYSGECDFVNGIEELKNDQNLFSFYPNPAIDKLTIEVNENATIKSVSIFSIDGKLIRQIPLSESKFDIDIIGLQSGIYLLEVEVADGFSGVKRFLIE